MAPNTEVVIFGTSAAFRADPKIGTKAMKYALEVGGAHPPAYYGVQIENPDTGYTFLDWDNFEAHQAFGKHPMFSTVKETFLESIDGNVEVYDVQFSGPVTAALEHPVTEVLVLSLKAPENRGAVVDILTKAFETSGGLFVFGQTRQDENKYIFIGGWPTVEAHWETAAKPDVAASISKLHSLANREHLYHTKLSKYSV